MGSSKAKADCPRTVLLLVGPTGSGKTPFGDYLAQRGLVGRRVLHFDFGQELRNVVSSNGVFSQSERDFVRRMLETGALLEDEHFEVAEKILLSFLLRQHSAVNDILLLNGLPRHLGQAKAIEQSFPVRALVLLECSAETVFARIRTNAGGDRTSRIDDTMEMVSKKLQIFYERTAPLVDFYQSLERRIIRLAVEPTSTPEVLFQQLERQGTTIL